MDIYQINTNNSFNLELLTYEIKQKGISVDGITKRQGLLEIEADISVPNTMSTLLDVVENHDNSIDTSFFNNKKISSSSSVFPGTNMTEYIGLSSGMVIPNGKFKYEWDYTLSTEIYGAGIVVKVIINDTEVYSCIHESSTIGAKQFRSGSIVITENSDIEHNAGIYVESFNGGESAIMLSANLEYSRIEE